MLDDLDFLAARIEQTVALMRKLQEAHAAAQAQVRQLEEERRQLANALQQREEAVAALERRVVEGEQALAGMQHQGEAQRQQFLLELDQYKGHCATLESRLTASQRVGEQLRQASQQACAQIDSLLVRLPGAPQE